MGESETGSSEGDLLGDMFRESSLREEVFRFEDIVLSEDQIQFTFSLNHLRFTSDIHLPTSISSVPALEPHRTLLFSIGMCVLPWYWMGFATKVIEISSKIGKFHPGIIEYWVEVYNNVLLEYLYLNKLDFDIEIHYTVDETPMTLGLTSDSPRRDATKVLIPIGGKQNLR